MRLLVPAVAAAAALVLAGCSEPEPGSPLPTGGGVATSDAPSAAPSETSSATPSTGGAEETEEATATVEPSATPSAAPTLPPEAMTNDAAGAEAFVRYWFSAINSVIAGGDAEPLREASSPECDLCLSYLNEAEGRALRGERVEKGRFTVEEAVGPAPDATGTTFVATAISRSAGRIVDSKGEVISTVDSEMTSVDAVLVRDGDSWLLYGFGS